MSVPAANLSQNTTTPTPDAAAATPPAQAQPAPDQLAPKFAALTKQERMLRQQRQQFKQEQQAYLTQKAEFDRQKQEWESEFKDKPFDALKKRGRTYEDLTQAALEGGKFKPEVEIKDLRDELGRFVAAQGEKEKVQQTQAAKQQEEYEQQIVADFRAGVTQVMKAEPDKYELTNRYDPEGDMVWSTIEEHWKRGEALFAKGEGPAPKALTKQEALDLVESFYESEIEKELTELPQTKKYQSKWKDKFGGKKADEPLPKSGGSTTLSNSMSSAAPTFVSAKTEHDRMQRAMAALNEK